MIEKAHKRWDQALKYRQNEVQKIRAVLYPDATRPVAETALEVGQGQGLDTGPITPPRPDYIELLTEDGLGPGDARPRWSPGPRAGCVQRVPAHRRGCRWGERAPPLRLKASSARCYSGVEQRCSG